MHFDAPVTMLVGDNGSGKSTIVEAIAEGFQLDSRGGRASRPLRSETFLTTLGEVIELETTPRGARMLRGPRLQKKGFLLRAETAFAEAGAQIVCATHSPILASLPGADIIEVGDEEMHRKPWEELQLVAH